MHSWAYKKVRKLPEMKGVLQMRVVSVPAAAVPLGRVLLTEPPGGLGFITHVKKAEEALGL